jgi:hypothetical protein
MPFLFFAMMTVVLLPVSLVDAVIFLPEDVYTSINKILIPIIKFTLASGIFIVYFVLTKRAIKRYGRIKIWWFAILFTISAILNLFFSYTVCAISVLKPCDPTHYLTLAGLLEIYNFYIIVFVSFITATGVIYYQNR